MHPGSAFEVAEGRKPMEPGPDGVVVFTKDLRAWSKALLTRDRCADVCVCFSHSFFPFFFLFVCLCDLPTWLAQADRDMLSNARQ